MFVLAGTLLERSSLTCFLSKISLHFLFFDNFVAGLLLSDLFITNGLLSEFFFNRKAS